MSTAAQMLTSLLRQDGPLGRMVHQIRCSLGGWSAAGLDLVFPPRCAACDAELNHGRGMLLLCEDCQVQMAPEVWHGCSHCGAAGMAEEQSPSGCPICHNSRLHFDCVIPLGSYRDRLRGVVLQMKRPYGEALAVAVARLLAKRRAAELAAVGADLIVPVPMHWMRRLRRGANSPEVMARCLGQALGTPVRRVLRRCRNTLPQAGLRPPQRFQNMRRAFRVRRAADLKGLKVLLVDDILTTGATCSEAAWTLRKAGAAAVVAAVVARAQGD